MPLDATAPQLDALLLAAVLQMELSPRDRRVADKRYQLVPEHLQRPNSPLRLHMDAALIYPQGSRAIGATIVHGDDDDRFDLDAMLEFPTPFGWTPRRVLDELERSFHGFPDVRAVVRCSRCVQLRFAFMHLDVTPMDPATAPRAERVGDIYHSPDRGMDERFTVNPYGFAEWFKGKFEHPTRMFQDHLQTMRARLEIKDRLEPGRIMADPDIDALPESNDPIRDAPQVIALKLMKRYLNLRYADRNEKRPVSVYLSKVAVEVPASPLGICAQLDAFAAALDDRMRQALEARELPAEHNPAFPAENFNDRWPKAWGEVQLFRADLAHLRREIARASCSDLSDIRRIFDELFGERVTEKAVRSYLDGRTGVATRSAFEHGRGFVASPAILRPTSAPASATRTSTAPAHSFHPAVLDAAPLKRKSKAPKPRSPQAQIGRMRQRWPALRLDLVGPNRHLAWTGPLRGFQMEYQVHVRWDWRNQTAIPHVLVLDPPLRPRSGSRFIDIPHLMLNPDEPELSALCLFDPGAGQWTPSMWISDTTIPWASEWLHHYECWHFDGTWRGANAPGPISVGEILDAWKVDDGAGS